MKYFIATILLCGFLIRGFAQTTIVDSVSYAGVTHYFRIYIPVHSKCSMIMHLHGYGSTAQLEQSYTNYMAIADTAGFMIAYPDGLKDNNGLQYWNIGWPGFPNTDDAGYLSMLIDTLSNRFGVDADKFFVSGFSMGGFMAHKLACELSDKVAAVASVSGSTTLSERVTCLPARAVPVLEIHGTADAEIPYAGTGDSTSINIDTLITFCGHIDQCNAVPLRDTLVHSANTTNVSSVVRYIYTGGAQNATCVLYKIIAGQHIDWPGAGASENNDFSASASIWNFFNEYHPSSCLGTGINSEPSLANGIGVSPNPSVTGEWNVTIADYAQFSQLQLLDITGSLVYSTTMTGSKTRVSLPQLASGVYIMRVTGNGGYANVRVVK